MIGLFALMCLIWGATWLAMKFGVASEPPVFFAGTRFVVAGLVMLLLAGLRGEVRRLDRRELPLAHLSTQLRTNQTLLVAVAAMIGLMCPGRFVASETIC